MHCFHVLMKFHHHKEYCWKYNLVLAISVNKINYYYWDALFPCFDEIPPLVKVVSLLSKVSFSSLRVWQSVFMASSCVLKSFSMCWRLFFRFPFCVSSSCILLFLSLRSCSRQSFSCSSSDLSFCMSVILSTSCALSSPSDECLDSSDDSVVTWTTTNYNMYIALVFRR